jgi:hypothetical protein
VAPSINEAHIANGYEVKQTHSGQRRRYGDSFYDFTIKSDKPESEVKEYCTKEVKECNLTSSEYIFDERNGVKEFGDHFRYHYKFRKVSQNEYFYQVISPSTH